MEYTKADDSLSSREIEAAGVIFSHPYWYLTAWCHLRGEYRMFRIDRIDHLSPTGNRHTIEQHPTVTNNEKYTMKINRIEVKTLSPIEVISIQHVGPYSGIGEAFGKLAAWAGANNHWSKGPRMIGIYHDDPTATAPEKLRSSACLEAKEGMEPAAGMTRYTVSGGKYLVMNAEVTMAEYGEAWQAIDAEVGKRGLQDDNRDHYELYIGSIDGTQGYDVPWIVEFCVPVK